MAGQDGGKDQEQSNISRAVWTRQTAKRLSGMFCGWPEGWSAWASGGRWCRARRRPLPIRARLAARSRERVDWSPSQHCGGAEHKRRRY